jgi:beta-glucosidase
MADGPNGLRKIKEVEGQAHSGSKTGTVTATAMPTLSLVATTWNEDLAKLDSATIADECIENDVQVLLAPGVNIKRTPLNGRNFEYISEDPILAGRMAKAYIEGAQEKGVGTSLKHYCANNRESYRFDQSSEVDERTLREIYLLPFEIATKANPWTVMCSYNPINGVFASENKYLLKDVLRDEFGFDGVIVSDWGAVTQRYKSLLASLDLQMPYHKDSFDNLKQALDKGLITEEDIDASVNRILELVEKSQKAKQIRKVEWTKQQRHQNGVEIAKEGIVKAINAGDFIKKYKLKGSSSVNKALEYLLNKEIVYHTTQGYIVYNRFLGIWLNTLV